MHAHAEGTALRRVLAGSVVGTALEWYDFFIHGTAAALVFGDLFLNDKAGSGVGTIGLEKPAQDALVSAPKVAKEEKLMEPVAS